MSVQRRAKALPPQPIEGEAGPIPFRAETARGTLLQTVSAVAWSFFGVRRRADYEQDVQKLNPVHVVIAGVGGAALFIVALVLLVRWVISSGVAT